VLLLGHAPPLFCLVVVFACSYYTARVDRYLVGVKLIDLLHLYTMHETIERDNDEIG